MNQLSYSSCCSVRRKFLMPNSFLSIPMIREKHTKKPKGWKFGDGAKVTAGTPLVYQERLKFHPGLNVGIACNLTLYAMEHGTVRISCEEAQPNWENFFINKFYPDKQGIKFYKKYYNIIPKPQTLKFNLVDQV